MFTLSGVAIRTVGIFEFKARTFSSFVRLLGVICLIVEQRILLYKITDAFGILVFIKR